MTRLKTWLFIMVAALSLIIVLPAAAQSAGQVITISGPPWIAYELGADDFFREFEEQTGADVVFIEENESAFQLQSAAYNPDEYFDTMLAYASSADVLFASSYYLTPDATIAGYFLNLSPLVESDPSFDMSDFYTGALDAYRWDRGLWAIPISMNMTFVVYQPDAFDAAGVSYPNENWTLDDYANAGRALTEYNSDGSVARPGMITGIRTATLMRAFLGQNFSDGSQSPAPPSLENPDLAALMERWQELRDEKLVENYEFQGDYNAIPLQFGGQWMLDENNGGPEMPEWSAAMLPGGQIDLSTDGFAVSAGTQNPELAYRLALYTAEKLASRFGGDPARRSISTSNEFYTPAYSDEDVAFLERARNNGLNGEAMRYSDYVDKALGMLSEDQTDAMTALQDVQQEALDVFNMAQEHANSDFVEVMPPPVGPELAEGEIALVFQADLYIQPLPNRDQWDAVLEQFADSHPGVGYVDFNTVNYGPEQNVPDCGYRAWNPLDDPNFDLSQLLSLDPFMDTDPDFDSNDFIGNTLASVQRDGRTYGYPITVEPEVLMINKERFQDAGVPIPNGTWTVDEFLRALDDLSFSAEEDESVLLIGGNNMQYLMLMASLGGLPLDFRQNPPTYNFTDPDTVAAVQQVLDLAKSGVIQYYPLTEQYRQSGGGGGGAVGPISMPMIMTGRIDPYSSMQGPFGMPGNDEDYENPFRFVSWPEGNRYTPIIYSVGSGYITADSRAPEACYDLLKTIASRPDLIFGMPASMSAISDPVVTAAAGPDLTAAYQSTAALLESPNVLQFRYSSSGPGDWLSQQFLNTVFDAYVLEDQPIDLEAQLAEAQEQTIAFNECIANIPPFPPEGFDTPEAYNEYFAQYVTCGQAVDPDFVDPFNLNG